LLHAASGSIPWSSGYHEAKIQLIGNLLADSPLLTLFREQSSLPEHYGVGFDERCIEYPWLLAHLEHGHQIVLDAGSALNHGYIVEHDLLRDKKVHILTLAPEGNCFWRQGISYLFDDLRHVPTRDVYYDTVVCISTL
jgi:hypothetical protein